MEYKVVFDITEAGFRGWAIPGSALALAGAGFVLLIAQRKWRDALKRYGGAVNVLALLLVVMSLLWVLISSVATYLEYSWLAEAAEGGRVDVVEGRVSDFKTIPTAGYVRERFCVRKTCFTYSDDVATGAFHQTRQNGGPLREGLSVRVTYVGTSIVRLEVAN
jgi:hypothetical protein